MCNLEIDVVVNDVTTKTETVEVTDREITIC